MRMSGMIGDKNEDPIFYGYRPQMAGGHNHDGSHREGRAADHAPCATLTERVVDFLEKYNRAIYGIG